jgi:predicted esterase
MKFTEGYIKTERTARYYTAGNIETSENILIVLHGYGYLAGNFIKKFSELALEKCYIIAPEGLSRFYVQGTDGLVGASWMTKEDRLNEINDYVKYLDLLFTDIAKPASQGKKIISLGFSQGCATLSRWMAFGHSEPDMMIFWCGTPVKDIDYSKTEKFKTIPVKLVLADNDRYIPEESIPEVELKLAANNIPYELFIFNGKHEIKIDILKKVINS